MNITENAAYLKGLYEGYELDGNSKEARLMGKMLELIGDMAEKIEGLEKECSDLRDYIDELDSDLGDVEEYLFCDDDEDEDDGDTAEEDSGYYEIECPNCGETVCFDDSMDMENLVCPACGKKICDVEICDGNCSECESEDCDGEE